MLKQLFICMSALLLTHSVFADNTMVVIKVNGAYGIINKGANQGVQKGLILYVKRETASGLIDVGRVKVIRLTANRAAVEQLTRNRVPILKKGDHLYLERETGFPTLTAETRSANEQPKKRERRPTRSRERLSAPTDSERVTPPTEQDEIEGAEASAVERQHRVVHQPIKKFRKPWITLNTGAVVPYNNFASAYGVGLMLGASYMVSAGNDFHIGLEINKTFFSEPTLASDADLGFTPNSGSLLEALVVLQRFFGRYFFFEAGAGLYRPKIRITSVDNIETVYSETNFGFFGGTGFFVPTSPYAGVSLRGRLHNYYDDSNRQYYGLTGGFRFKIR